MELNVSGLKDRSTTRIQNMLIRGMKKELLHMPCLIMSSQTLTVMGTTIRFIYCCHGGIYDVLYQYIQVYI